MNRSLSSDEVQKLVRCNFILYPDLKNMSLEDVFRINDCAVILFLTDHNYGHFICLTRNGKLISFQDSYGYSPDGEYQFINSNDKKKLKQTGAYISNLLMKAMDIGYKIEFNEVHNQSDNEDVATCGRWCVIRCLFKELNNDEFNLMISNVCKKGNMTPDKLVVSLTEPYLSMRSGRSGRSKSF